MGFRGLLYLSIADALTGSSRVTPAGAVAFATLRDFFEGGGRGHLKGG
jgi:hypothetical protein